MLNVKEIQEIIPHRPPFLLVDRIVEMEVGKRAVGIKNVTINEPFFIGHFPEYPVMPGVLITEALAQVGAAAILQEESNKGKIGFLGLALTDSVSEDKSFRAIRSVWKWKSPD